MARPHTFWSMEYGDFSVWVIGNLCSLANAISTSRVRDRSRIGLMAFSVGLMEAMETFETDLVVALAGATVGDGVGAELVGGAHEVLGDQRTGDGGDQRVDAFVHGVGLEGLHAIFVGELVTGVDHVGFDGSAGKRRAA